MSLFLLRLRVTSSRNTPPRRSEWGSSLPPDCFVSRGNISPYGYFLTFVFYGERLLAPCLTPQAGEPPLVGCPRLLIQFIHSYPPYWRPFLHPQSEDALCRGDKDPHSWTKIIYLYLPIVSLSCVQKGVSYPRVKIFNSLQRNTQSHRTDRKRFKTKLYRYLIFQSLY